MSSTVTDGPVMSALVLVKHRCQVSAGAMIIYLKHLSRFLVCGVKIEKDYSYFAYLVFLCPSHESDDDISQATVEVQQD